MRHTSAVMLFWTSRTFDSQFDVKAICSHSARLSTEQLDECNRLEIIEHINDPIKCDVLIKHLQELIKKAYPNELSCLESFNSHKYNINSHDAPFVFRVDSLVLERAHIRNVLHWASDRITSLDQLVEGNLSFLWILPKIKNDEIHAELLESLIAQLEKGEFDKHHLQALLKEFSAKNNLKFPKFMKSLRAKLSGLSDGPGVADMMEILGKKITIERFRKMLPKKEDRKTAEQKWNVVDSGYLIR